jgi:TonB-dependent starch-binding outer membrane protein SusC
LFSVDPSLSYYAITGSNTSTAQGFRSSALGNPNTGWQKDEQTDIGLDVALWNSKLYFSADYFFKKSDGLLFPLAVPALLGGASAPFVNIGNIENKGFDLLLGSKGNLSRDFKFDVAVTWSLYRNRITKLNEGQTYFSSGVARNQVGHPISAFYGYEIIGFFNSEDEIAKSPVQADAKPGRFKYKNANNILTTTNPTQKIDDSDRTFFGDPNPKFSLGLNIAFSFKNFDISTFFYGVFGNQLMNAVKRGLDRGANQIALNESWTPDNHNAIAPILENINTFSNLGQPENSYGLEDGTYFRNKSMILGYSLPRTLIQQFKIRQFRVYFQVTNLFTITSYSGLDPETIGNYPFMGIDNGNNPNNQKQWLFGFNIGFQ